MHLHDVILAIASPAGRSLRGIIRLSGAGAFDLVRPVLKPGDDSTSAHHVGHLRGAQPSRLMVQAGRDVAAMMLWFPAPHSYTGEDSLEIQLPGNRDLLEGVLNHLITVAGGISISARRAEPGEFTARAYLNGRLSLTQAEGVAATIAAQSDAELRAAHLLTRGAFGSLAQSLANDLASALALMEAGIDFTDQEDVVAISPDDLLSRLVRLRRLIADQLDRAVGAERLHAIPWAVIRGRPNAGKSALFNALLGRERAMVSPIAGTTRDVLAEPLTVQTPAGPGEVMLVDVAGIDSDDASVINQMMQSAANEAMLRAELVLRCVPVDEDIADVEPEDLVVRTKADITLRGHHRSVDAIAVSAFNGVGLDALRKAISARLAGRAVSLAADATALQPRHEASLHSAMDNIGRAIGLVEPLARDQARSFPNPELIAAAMRAALDDLSSLAGDITPDDVLGRVFNTFCVGK